MQKGNENLNTVYKYCKRELLHYEIFDILKGDNELLKPLAVLSLKKLESKEEGELLLAHLTGVDGKIREAVSYKAAELYGEYKDFLDNPKLYTDALCDVNPNVCRNIIELLTKYPIAPEHILKRAEEILEEVDKICSKFKRNREKSHALNVKLFNLYWCLEGFYCIYDGYTNNRLEKILLRCADMHDYTIREKVAKILVKMKNAPIGLLQKLENDLNFYVKKQLCGNI